MFDHYEETQSLTVDDTAKGYMLEMGRWGKFLAIVTIILLILMVLLGIVTVSGLSSVASSSEYTEYGGNPQVATFTGYFMAFVFTVVIALYIYPVYALYKYSTMVKQGILGNDQYVFNEAFRHLKGAFRYMGILTLIGISIYALIFLFTGVGMFFAS